MTINILPNTAKAQGSYNNEGIIAGTYCPLCNCLVVNYTCCCEDPDVDVCACDICNETIDCDFGCPYCSDNNGTGIADDGTTGDPTGGGSTTVGGGSTTVGGGGSNEGGSGGSTSTPNCSCCRQNPCRCSSTSLRIADANNSFRFVETGGTLVVVSHNNPRTANMTVSYSGFTPQSGYPLWGGSVSGMGNSVSYAFSGSSGGVNVKLGPNCPTLAGNVLLVPENYLSSSITVNLNELTNMFNSFLSSKTDGANFNFGLNVSSTIVTKYVDKYIDGTQVGNYTKFKAAASATFAGGEMKIPVYTVGAASVFFKLKFKGITCNGDLNFAQDESISNSYSGSGSLSLGIAGASGSITGALGNPLVCEAGITGQVNIGQIGLTGTATVDASGVKLSAKMNPTTVTANVYIFAKNVVTDTECTLKLMEDKELLKIGQDANLGSITVCTFNN